MRRIALALALVLLVLHAPVGAINGTVVIVASDVQNTSNTVWADVTGLTHSVSANTTYYFDCVGAYTTAVSTTAIHLGFNGPASPNSSVLTMEVFTSTTGDHGDAVLAYDTVSNPSSSQGATAMPFRLAGTLENGANAGTLAIRFKSEINTSAVNVLRGSACVFF